MSKIVASAPPPINNQDMSNGTTMPQNTSMPINTQDGSMDVDARKVADVADLTGNTSTLSSYGNAPRASPASNLYTNTVIAPLPFPQNSNGAQKTADAEMINGEDSSISLPSGPLGNNVAPSAHTQKSRIDPQDINDAEMNDKGDNKVQSSVDRLANRLAQTSRTAHSSAEAPDTTDTEMEDEGEKKETSHMTVAVGISQPEIKRFDIKNGSIWNAPHLNAKADPRNSTKSKKRKHPDDQVSTVRNVETHYHPKSRVSSLRQVVRSRLSLRRRFSPSYETPTSSRRVSHCLLLSV
jgi:hypothetical protein